tara:strand:+ start:745 stop:960 length:216 start_codon:yes stop_codon:yes gene_type:complete
MKISNDASVQIRNIKAAIDDAYVKLDVKLYKKNDAVRVSYSEVNVFEIVSENFEYISKIIRDLQESERVSD